MPVLPKPGCALKTNSYLYRLDPRTKFLLVVIFTVLVFTVDSLLVAVFQMCFFLVLCLLGNISLAKIFLHWKFLLFLILLVIGLQILFGDGIYTGLMISCRIVALTVLLPMLTMSTEPQLLALGICKLGLNYRAAQIITSTFNLIPSFEDETRHIMEARKLRGVDCFKKGNIIAKLKEYPAIALPLMIKAMRKAQLIGIAMDARAFGAYKTRTWLLTIQLSVRDLAAFSAGIAYAITALTVNYMLKR